MGEPKIIKVEETKENFREKISDLLEDMWEKIGRYHHGVAGRVARRDDSPDTDLSETGNVLTYKMDLPGMDENDVEVVIDADRLTIRGERFDEREETGKNYIFSERSYGNVARSFLLPGGVDQDHVQARFEKGVLTVTIPYAASGDGNPRRIDVTGD